MESSKVRFSIKGKKEQNCAEQKQSPQRNDDKGNGFLIEDSRYNNHGRAGSFFVDEKNKVPGKNNCLEIFSEKSNEHENKAVKVSMITSFSNLEDSKKSSEENDTSHNEYIIKCKHSLGKRDSRSSIELLFENRKRLSEFESSTDSNYIRKEEHSIPIEKFGLAMLKGMGYNPEIHNTKPKIFKKRNYNQSGLGADTEIKKLMGKQ